jgi:hypothetical protein
MRAQRKPQPPHTSLSERGEHNAAQAQSISRQGEQSGVQQTYRSAVSDSNGRTTNEGRRARSIEDVSGASTLANEGDDSVESSPTSQRAAEATDDRNYSYCDLLQLFLWIQRRDLDLHTAWQETNDRERQERERWQHQCVNERQEATRRFHELLSRLTTVSRR